MLTSGLMQVSGLCVSSTSLFTAAYFVALRPEKLTQRLGRILCPALLVLIVVLFAGCILRPAASGYGVPTAAYAALPAAQGILDGYQTMDALAALNFGAVIALNIQAVGITEEAAVRRGTIRAGLVAGGMLLVVYAMLTHIGGISGAAFPGCDTGAAVLTALADGLFGRVGQVLLAAIFVIACFNTCVGLIASVGEYFHELLPRLSYPAIAAPLFGTDDGCFWPARSASLRTSPVSCPGAGTPSLPYSLSSHRGGVSAGTVPAPSGLAAGRPLYRPSEHPRCPALRPSLRVHERPASERPPRPASSRPSSASVSASSYNVKNCRIAGQGGFRCKHFAELRMAAMTLRRTDGSV